MELQRACNFHWNNKFPDIHIKLRREKLKNINL